MLSSQQHLEQVSIDVIVLHDTDKIPGVCYALYHLMGLGPLVVQAAPLSRPELEGLILQQDVSPDPVSAELAVQHTARAQPRQDWDGNKHVLNCLGTHEVQDHTPAHLPDREGLGIHDGGLHHLLRRENPPGHCIDRV